MSTKKGTGGNKGSKTAKQEKQVWKGLVIAFVAVIAIPTLFAFFFSLPKAPKVSTEVISQQERPYGMYPLQEVVFETSGCGNITLSLMSWSGISTSGLQTAYFQYQDASEEYTSMISATTVHGQDDIIVQSMGCQQVKLGRFDGIVNGQAVIWTTYRLPLVAPTQ